MPPTCNHARHSEPGGINCRRPCIRIGCCCLCEEIFDEIFESCIVPGRKTTLKDRTQGEPFLQEQPKVAFCAANVPGENHRFLTPYTCACSKCFRVGNPLNGFPSLFLRDA